MPVPEQTVPFDKLILEAVRLVLPSYSLCCALVRVRCNFGSRDSSPASSRLLHDPGQDVFWAANVEGFPGSAPGSTPPNSIHQLLQSRCREVLANHVLGCSDVTAAKMPAGWVNKVRWVSRDVLYKRANPNNGS